MSRARFFVPIKLICGSLIKKLIFEGLVRLEIKT